MFCVKVQLCFSFSKQQFRKVYNILPPATPSFICVILHCGTRTSGAMAVTNFTMDSKLSNFSFYNNSTNGFGHMSNVTNNVTTFADKPTPAPTLSDRQREFNYMMSIYSFVFWKIYYYAIPVVCVIGIITNILLIITMIKTPKLRMNSAGILMVILACDELIVFILKLPYHMNYFHLLFGQPACTIVAYLSRVTVNVSHFIVFLMGINRYAIVCLPFTHMKVTSIKSTIIQFVSGAVSIALLQIFNFFIQDPVDNYCRIVNVKYFWVYFISIFTIDLVLLNLLPIVVTTVLTIKVVWTFVKKKTTIKGSTNQKGTLTKGEMNITKALIAIIVTFIALFIPYFISFCIYSVPVGLQHLDWYTVDPFLYWRSYTAFIIFAVIEMCNYGINLFIYTWFSPTFRASLAQVLTYGRRGKG